MGGVRVAIQLTRKEAMGEGRAGNWTFGKMGEEVTQKYQEDGRERKTKNLFSSFSRGRVGSGILLK